MLDIDVMLPNEIYRVTEEEKRIIEKSYGKSKEEIEEFLEILKEWIKTQPHIPQEQDELLLRMIMALNKFNMDKIKKKLDMFYAIRNIVPEFFSDRSPLTEQMQNISKQYNITPLPQLLNGQQRVYMSRFIVEADGSFDVLALARLVFLVYDLRIHLDCATSEVFVVDLQNIRLQHVIRMSPFIMTRMYSVLEKGFSDRIKGIHFINTPSIANIFVALIKYIVNFKIANRVHSHKDIKSLHEQVPKECLPSEYGGCLKTLQEMHADWQNFIESRDEWIVEQGNKRTDETLRPEKSKTPGMFNSIFNLFRKS